MKSTTATGSAGIVLFIAWLWNDFGSWWANGFQAGNYPTLTIEAAAGLLMLCAALVSRFLDKIDG